MPPKKVLKNAAFTAFVILVNVLNSSCVYTHAYLTAVTPERALATKHYFYQCDSDHAVVKITARSYFADLRWRVQVLIEVSNYLEEGLSLDWRRARLECGSFQQLVATSAYSQGEYMAEAISLPRGEKTRVSLGFATPDSAVEFEKCDFLKASLGELRNPQDSLACSLPTFYLFPKK